MAPDDPQEPLRRDIIVIGGSAGSLDTLRAIALALPADFAGTVFIVAHVGQSRSILPDLLRRAGKLTASHPREQERIRRRHIYVAPPDRHMLIEDGNVCLSRGPREHFTRPAIDPLFRSAARACGARVIGVVLSGGGSDGAVGLAAIQDAGGLAVVEDPSEAAFPDMPQTAASLREPDFVARAVDIPALLVRLPAERVLVAPAKATEGVPVTMETNDFERPVAFSCPECGGALKVHLKNGLDEYGCHVGHRFGAMELLESQYEGVEKGIYVALRMLNEQAEFARRMIASARNAPLDNGLVYWERLQVQAEEQAETLRRFLEQRPIVGLMPEAADG
ncbi:MAG: chemotaxis protein CheB [Alphaproteobacteria bacterium]|nr:chemotaxis protein CheB [Alphaproteobacteria bacterium]MBV9378110.1 chemotaxis protein CheB [Alphaproteobacteria bacterium]